LFSPNLVESKSSGMSSWEKTTHLGMSVVVSFFGKKIRKNSLDNLAVCCINVVIQ
jgi:hypothetical protein